MSYKVNYAFLVHSQDSLGHHSHPHVDDQRLARQKRRRTSPEDQAILEAEYKRNPKPDKATRLEVVRLVALGEKEVQIWFQNRRQMTRRKSRPLEVHELDSSSIPTREDAVNESVSDVIASQRSPSSSQSSTRSDQGKTGFDERSQARAENLQPLEEQGDRSNLPVKTAKRYDGLCQTFKMDSAGTMRPREPADMFKPLSPSNRRPGYLANRRSAPFIIHEDSSNTSSQGSLSQSQSSDTSEKDTMLAGTAPPLGRTASLVKLSMDAEGKAEVTLRTGNTPSPPHPRSSVLSNLVHKRGPGLHRSFSAIEPRSYKNAVSDGVNTISCRQSLGRSRDARTWEFYCDSSARDALIKQAEAEESGSATAAIGLIRPRSNNQKRLTPNPNKRNAQVQKHDCAKRHKPGNVKQSKTKLERAISSVARLQTTTSNSAKQKTDKHTAKHEKRSSQSAVFEDFEGDSDKENWEPGTQTRPPPWRRPVTTPNTARILLERLREPSESSSVGAMLGRKGVQKQSSKPKSLDKENNAPEFDEEVAAFMGEASLPREDEDLDCVQNLLSLSHAAWV